MARIAPAPADVYAPVFGEEAPLRVQVYANRPEIAQALPLFDVDAYGSIAWVEAIAGGYLITSSTGNLVFLPELA